MSGSGDSDNYQEHPGRDANTVPALHLYEGHFRERGYI